MPKDAKESVKWYRKAAARGDANATFNLSVAYAYDKGVTQDDKETIKWLRKAADLGDAEAMYNLGVLYATSRR